MHLRAINFVTADDVQTNSLCNQRHRQSIRIWTVKAAGKQRHLELSDLRRRTGVNDNVFSE
jgi:hypothetical protein